MHSLVDYHRKWVVVTGATSGIGEAISLELRRQGARLIIVGRDINKLNSLMSRIGNDDNYVMCLDLNDCADIVPKVKKISEKTGRIYGFCHAAGIVETRPLHSINTEKLKAILDVNFVSGIEMARAVCRRDIMEEEGGSILFISSIYGLIGMAGEIGYSASKGAIIAAARTMAVELAKRKIRVNTISPGFVKTRMTDIALSILDEKQRQELIAAHPLGVGTPEDVARASVFLMAPQNAWITGANLVIDGGFTAR